MYPTRVAMMRYTGKATLELLDRSAGGGFKNTVETAGTALEKKYPELTEGRIQGTKPHRSSKDPSDPKEVITVSYHTASGTRLVSIHAHEDGTWNEYFSRAGQKRRDGEASSSATTTNPA